MWTDNTRNAKIEGDQIEVFRLFITRANHEFAKKSLRHSIIVTVNNTITSITNKTLTHSLDGFAKYVKKSIIQSYESNCCINNCYVCSSLDP